MKRKRNVRLIARYNPFPASQDAMWKSLAQRFALVLDILDRKTAMAVSLVSPRLDHCNSCMWGVPQKPATTKTTSSTCPKYRREKTKTKRSDHINPILRELHWLPVEKYGAPFVK